MESNASRYLCVKGLCHIDWACLFVFNKKTPKRCIFGNCKGEMTKPQVNEVLTPDFSQHGEPSVNGKIK